VKVLHFPLECSESNKAERIAALLYALHTLDALENKLEAAGALKGAYVVCGVRIELLKEYPEFFTPLRLDGGGTDS
jgi:hypothetical protein